MPKIKLFIEDVSKEQAEKLQTELGNIAGCTVTMEEIKPMRDPGPAVGDLDGRLPDIDADEPGPISGYQRFTSALAEAINANSMENGSDTPDYMLASFLTEVLQSYDRLMQERDRWYGGSHRRLKAQLEAEGEHTAAATAEIGQLKAELAKAQSPVGWGNKTG